MAWQVYELTNSPLSIGLLGLARALPGVAFLLLGGLVADATDRRRLLMAAQVGYFVVSAVPREALGSAIALNSTQRSVGAVAGPSMAGLLLAASGAAACYAVEALSWLAMLGALALIRVRPDSGLRRGAVSFRAFRSGVDFVLANPVLLLMMLLNFWATLFNVPNALLPIYARDILQMGPAGLGMLHTAIALGSVAGGAVMSLAATPARAALWALAGTGLYGASMLAFGLSSTPLACALLLACTGIGSTISLVVRTAIDMLVTPDDLRGRVASIRASFTNTGPQFGQLRAGAVAEVWGAQAAAFTGGLATLLLVGGMALLPAVRRFRLPDEAERP
jgi:MFS family permease